MSSGKLMPCPLPAYPNIVYRNLAIFKQKWKTGKDIMCIECQWQWYISHQFTCL